MATFKAVVRRPRTDGFYSVYIRVTHRRQTLFIKTRCLPNVSLLAVVRFQTLLCFSSVGTAIRDSR